MQFLHCVSYPTKFGIKLKGTISAEWTLSTTGNSSLPWPEKAAEAVPDSMENNAAVGATAAQQDACFFCGQARVPPPAFTLVGTLTCASAAQKKQKPRKGGALTPTAQSLTLWQSSPPSKLQENGD